MHTFYPGSYVTCAPDDIVTYPPVIYTICINSIRALCNLYTGSPRYNYISTHSLYIIHPFYPGPYVAYPLEYVVTYPPILYTLYIHFTRGPTNAILFFTLLIKLVHCCHHWFDRLINSVKCAHFSLST